MRSVMFQINEYDDNDDGRHFRCNIRKAVKAQLCCGRNFLASLHELVTVGTMR